MNVSFGKLINELVDDVEERMSSIDVYFLIIK